MEKIRNSMGNKKMNITTDNKGNEYKKFYVEGEGNVILCLGGQNHHYNGKTNISFREGKSVFGKEAIIQLEINKLLSVYPSSSGFNNHIEFYFNEEQIKQVIKDLQEVLQCKENTK